MDRRWWLCGVLLLAGCGADAPGGLDAGSGVPQSVVATTVVPTSTVPVGTDPPGTTVPAAEVAAFDEPVVSSTLAPVTTVAPTTTAPPPTTTTAPPPTTVPQTVVTKRMPVPYGALTAEEAEVLNLVGQRAGRALTVDGNLMAAARSGDLGLAELSDWAPGGGLRVKCPGGPTASMAQVIADCQLGFSSLVPPTHIGVAIETGSSRGVTVVVGAWA